MARPKSVGRQRDERPEREALASSIADAAQRAVPSPARYPTSLMRAALDVLEGRAVAAPTMAARVIAAYRAANGPEGEHREFGYGPLRQWQSITRLADDCRAAAGALPRTDDRRATYLAAAAKHEEEAAVMVRAALAPIDPRFANLTAEGVADALTIGDKWQRLARLTLDCGALDAPPNDGTVRTLDREKNRLVRSQRSKKA